jgi:MFS family permease
VLGLAYAGIGFGLSAAFVRETAGHAILEGGPRDDLALRDVLARVTFRERTLSACSQAGFVSNLNDAAAWGLFPLLFASADLSLDRIGLLVALYPAAWGLGQPAFGALSDRIGRRPLIVGGMWAQAGGLALVSASRSSLGWGAGALLLGIGTAMSYPTLIAAVGDAAHPSWRASAMGAYRCWRDVGFAAGAVLSGVVADAAGLRAAIALVAGLTAVSGTLAAVLMKGGAKRV